MVIQISLYVCKTLNYLQIKKNNVMNFTSKTEFEIYCLQKDEESTQQIVNRENKNKMVTKCAQNLDEKKYLESLSWKFQRISISGKNKAFQMVKLFQPIN